MKSKALIYVSFLQLHFIFTGCAHREITTCEKNSKTVVTPYNETTLDFYSTKDPYGEFSNFANFPIFLDSQWWPTSEHYYQAHKYETEELRNWVRAAPTPMEAAIRGRDPEIPKRKDWDLKKDEIMEKTVSDKFNRYTCLKKLLLSTGQAKIFEHTKNDCYWGDCGDRTGKNKLGLLLEKIRGQIRE